MPRALPLPPDAHGAPRELRRAADGQLRLAQGEAERPLPPGALDALFARYGRPLAAGVQPAGEGLDLDGGDRLVPLAHRSPVDVVANHHFVLVRPGAPPLAVPAPLFVGALAALAGGSR
jgi:hypothetical protein